MKLFTGKTYIILIVGVIAMLFILSYSSEKGSRPDNPMQLLQEPCPGTPNCISTMYPEDSDHFLPPLPFKENLEKSKEFIIKIIENNSGAEIIENNDTMIYAQFTIPIFRFIDDTVFLFGKERKIIHFHSSSRIGTWDLGVNRRRMKKISQHYLNSM